MNQKLNKYKQLFYFLLENKERIKEIIQDLYDIYLRIRWLYDEYEALYRRTEWVWWIIDDEPKPTDYIVWNEGWFEFVSRKNPWKRLREFNQKKWIHISSCSIFALCWMANYNMWLWLTQEDVERFSTELINEWIIVVWKWAKFPDVSDRLYHKLKSMWFDVLYHTLTVFSDMFEIWLKNWWWFAIWYRTDIKHFRDTQDNGILDWCEYDKVWGHAVWCRMIDWELEVINSYKWVIKYNRFKFKEWLEQLRCLAKKNKYYMNARILYFKKDIVMPINDIKLIEKAIELWITNDKTLLEKVKVWNYDVDVRNTIRIMRWLEKCWCLKSKKK